MTKPDPFRYFKTSREIIRLAVMLYVRFPLSLRNVEDLLHERGIDVSHEAVRYWWHRFPIEANKLYKVAGWAPVDTGAQGEPVWEVVTRYLRDRKTIPPLKLNLPRLIGVQGNAGIAA